MKFGLSSYDVINTLERKGITSDKVDENILNAIAIAIEENNKALEKRIAEKVAEDFMRKARNIGIKL